MAQLKRKILNIIKFKKISWLILSLSFWSPKIWTIDPVKPDATLKPAATSSYWMRIYNTASTYTATAIAAIYSTKERLLSAPAPNKPPTRLTEPESAPPVTALLARSDCQAQPSAAPHKSTTATALQLLPMRLAATTSPSPPIPSPTTDTLTTNLSPCPDIPILMAKTIPSQPGKNVAKPLIRPTPMHQSTSCRALTPNRSIHDIIMQANPKSLEQFLADIKQNTLLGRLTAIRLEAFLQQRDSLKNTPLHTAVLMANPELVAIIQHETQALGIDLRDCKNINKYTPSDFLSDAHRTYAENETDIYLPRNDPVTQKPATITRYYGTTYAAYVHAGQINPDRYDQLRHALYPESLESQISDSDLTETHMPKFSADYFKDTPKENLVASPAGEDHNFFIQADSPITDRAAQPELFQKTVHEPIMAVDTQAPKRAAAKIKMRKLSLNTKIINFKKTLAAAAIKNKLKKSLEAHRNFVLSQQELKAIVLEQKLTKIPKLLDRIAVAPKTTRNPHIITDYPSRVFCLLPIKD
jgi:hypothetical protein